jgi:hypothetical protein
MKKTSMSPGDGEVAARAEFAARAEVAAGAEVAVAVVWVDPGDA